MLSKFVYDCKVKWICLFWKYEAFEAIVYFFVKYDAPDNWNKQAETATSLQ